MNIQNTQFNQKNPIKLFCILCAACAALLTVSWFLPMVSYRDTSYSYLDILSMEKLFRVENSEQELLAFWCVVICSATTVIWSILPKKWASVAGFICSSVLMFMCFGIRANVSEQDLDLAFGSTLLVVFSILLLAASLGKLALVMKMSKQTPAAPGEKTNNAD